MRDIPDPTPEFTSVYVARTDGVCRGHSDGFIAIDGA